MSKSPDLIVIAGPNGSGKTSLTQKLMIHEWANGCVFVNPDQLAQDLFGGWNVPDAVIKAANEAERIREACLEEKSSLVFETVMSTESKVDFIKRAKAAGYFVRLFFVSTNSPTINCSRIAQRVMSGGHTVPIEKVISRYAKSIVNCADVIRHVDRAYIYDNSQEMVDPKLLFRTTDGYLTKLYCENREINIWAQPLLDAVRDKVCDQNSSIFPGGM